MADSRKIVLTELNRSEALRYLACREGQELGGTVEAYLDECEKRLLQALEPKYLYRYFPIKSAEGEKVVLDGCMLTLEGHDISEHLKGCSGAVVMCATIGQGADRLIRIMQIEDMAKAVITDALASAAVEEVCNRAEEIVKEELEGNFFTWRYSPGYGDLPIDIQKSFIAVLDAPRKIGLCTGESRMLAPVKSVTAVMGVSEKEVPRRQRGCITCNMREVCQFRKRGLHCEL
ncbi:MAG: methionine synthase [Huintestinicola sp.]